jgi:hypothetical protein
VNGESRRQYVAEIVFFGFFALLGVVMATLTFSDEGGRSRSGWIITTFAVVNGAHVLMLVATRRSDRRK